MKIQSKTLLEEVLEVLEDRIQKAEWLQVERLEDQERKADHDDRFIARCPAVKDFYFALPEVKAYIEQEYRKELDFSKRDIFPTMWMLKNIKIENQRLVFYANHILNKQHESNNTHNKSFNSKLQLPG